MSELASLLNTKNTVEVITKNTKGAENWDTNQVFPIVRLMAISFYVSGESENFSNKKLKHLLSIYLSQIAGKAPTILPIAKKFKLPIISLAHGNDVLLKDKTFRKNKITRTLMECQHVVAVSDTTKKDGLSLGIPLCHHQQWYQHRCLFKY